MRPYCGKSAKRKRSAEKDGTLIPILFKKIGIDPAVASGPLITTVNDLVAVCVYYGISLLLFVEIGVFVV